MRKGTKIRKSKTHKQNTFEFVRAWLFLISSVCTEHVLLSFKILVSKFEGFGRADYDGRTRVALLRLCIIQSQFTSPVTNTIQSQFTSPVTNIIQSQFTSPVTNIIQSQFTRRRWWRVDRLWSCTTDLRCWNIVSEDCNAKRRQSKWFVIMPSFCLCRWNATRSKTRRL